MSSSDPDRRYKICLLGEGRVGKTSILLRYVREVFDDRQASTLTASCLDKTVPLGGGDSARVTIWDTAGQERFHALGPLYYRDADGALLVYDITDEASFRRVQDWVRELRKMLGDDIAIALCGNKADMEKSRNVVAKDVLEYCASIDATHHLTSAKLGTGIQEAFAELVRRASARLSGRRGGIFSRVRARLHAPIPFPPPPAGAIAKKRSAAASRPASVTRPRLAIVEDDEPKKPQGGCCGGK